jgi:hypothetical protein
MRCVYAPTMLMRLITLVFGRIRLRRAYRYLYSGSGMVLRHMVHLMHLWQREAGQRAWGEFASRRRAARGTQRAAVAWILDRNRIQKTR